MGTFGAFVHGLGIRKWRAGVRLAGSCRDDCTDRVIKHAKRDESYSAHQAKWGVAGIDVAFEGLEVAAFPHGRADIPLALGQHVRLEVR